MATSVTTAVAKYRLLYVQPDPENGDRVCIGVVVDDPSSRASVAYDTAFSKLRCVTHEYDFQLLRFYLDDLRLQLKSTSSPETVLSRYSPILVSSEPRLVSAPVTDAT